MTLRLVLVQHVLELSERSNTGRVAAQVDPRLEVRRYGVKEAPLRLDDLGDAHLLWPGEGRAPTPAPSTLIILDASWSQARRMVQRVPLFRSLPRVSLPPRPDRERLRAAPAGGLSTLEAIADAVERFEGPAAAAPFHAAHRALVDRQRAQRGYVGPQDRSSSRG